MTCSPSRRYWTPEELDETTYTVRALGADRGQADHLRVLAVLGGENWRTVRERLTAEPSSVVWRGRAHAVAAVCAALAAAGLRFAVTPRSPRDRGGLPSADANPRGS